MKDEHSYLFHIRDAIQKIAEYTSAGEDFFFGDRRTQDAVIRNIEIIGEAVKQLSDDLKAAHPDIPWKRIAGMRDIVIHEYFGVRLDLVWQAIEHDLPVLKGKIDSLLGP